MTLRERGPLCDGALHDAPLAAGGEMRSESRRAVYLSGWERPAGLTMRL